MVEPPCENSPVVTLTMAARKNEIGRTPQWL
jgi:hypothetical protein